MKENLKGLSIEEAVNMQLAWENNFFNRGEKMTKKSLDYWLQQIEKNRGTNAGLPGSYEWYLKEFNG